MRKSPRLRGVSVIFSFFCRLKHIFDKYAVAAGRVADEDIGKVMIPTPKKSSHSTV